VTGTARVRLLDADPDLGRYLKPEERTEAMALTVPAVDLPVGPVDVPALLARTASFGAFVVDGMLAAHLRVGEQAGMRIIGPGDVVSPGDTSASMLLADAGCRAAVPTRIALLGKDVLVGGHRWPRLIAGLHARATEQIERIAVQLAICQLPRVEDRLLALLWLLAETWGRVTPSGTSLPINLTHETLGALIGARRPTVTLALGELTERGAIIRQGKSWLLIERPAAPTGTMRPPHAPELVAERASPWGLPEEPAYRTRAARAEIAATYERLREDHAHNSAVLETRLLEVRANRERSIELRDRIQSSRPVRPRPAPS